MDLPALVVALLDRQDGLVTRAQLASAGLPRRALDSAVADGSWLAVHRTVFRRADAAVTPWQVLRGWLLASGEAACLTGSTGCAEHGLRYAGRSPVAVGVPHAARPPLVAGRLVVRSERTFPLDPGLLLPTATLVRCIGDAARHLLDDQRSCHAVVCEATQRGLLTPDELAAEAEAGPRRTRGPLLRAVDAAAAGSWSAPEVEAAELLSPLGPLHRNCLVLDAAGHVLGRPDLHAVGSAALVEVESREHHGDGDFFEDTVARQARWLAAGYLPMPVTPRQLQGRTALVRSRWQRLLDIAPAAPAGWCRLLDGTVVPHAGASSRVA